MVVQKQIYIDDGNCQFEWNICSLCFAAWNAETHQQQSSVNCVLGVKVNIDNFECATINNIFTGKPNYLLYALGNQNDTI